MLHKIIAVPLVLALLLSGCSLLSSSSTTPTTTAASVATAAKISGEITKIQGIITKFTSIDATLGPKLPPATQATIAQVLGKASSVLTDLQSALTAYEAAPTATGKAALQAKISAIDAALGALINTAQQTGLISASNATDADLVLAALDGIILGLEGNL